MPDVSPWVEFGLAGLFGVFALVMTRTFLNHLSEQSEQWRKRLDKLDGTIRDLDITIQKLNNK